MPLLAIAALAAGTYAFRLAGPLSGNRLRVPRRLQRSPQLRAVYGTAVPSKYVTALSKAAIPIS